MNPVKIKFCGITNLEDACNAIEAGADMLGFNFYQKSPRFINPTVCARIIQGVRVHFRPDTVGTAMVGIFVNETLSTVNRIIKQCQLDLVQLSGNETPGYVQDIGDKAIKVIRTNKNESFIHRAERYPLRQDPPFFVLDAAVNGAYGGTGKTIDWYQAAEIASIMPVLLAGGLYPGNVRHAVELVQPWGVDVASGIEYSPGKKDSDLMKNFVSEVRSVYQLKVES
jgi:phosphoribosylanthranilate isomerase